MIQQRKCHSYKRWPFCKSSLLIILKPRIKSIVMKNNWCIYKEYRSLLYYPLLSQKWISLIILLIKFNKRIQFFVEDLKEPHYSRYSQAFYTHEWTRPQTRKTNKLKRDNQMTVISTQNVNPFLCDQCASNWWLKLDVNNAKNEDESTCVLKSEISNLWISV